MTMGFIGTDSTLWIEDVVNKFGWHFSTFRGHHHTEHRVTIIQLFKRVWRGKPKATLQSIQLYQFRHIQTLPEGIHKDISQCVCHQCDYIMSSLSGTWQLLFHLLIRWCYQVYMSDIQCMSHMFVGFRFLSSYCNALCSCFEMQLTVIVLAMEGEVHNCSKIITQERQKL